MAYRTRSRRTRSRTASRRRNTSVSRRRSRRTSAGYSTRGRRTGTVRRARAAGQRTVRIVIEQPSASPVLRDAQTGAFLTADNQPARTAPKF